MTFYAQGKGGGGRRQVKQLPRDIRNKGPAFTGLSLWSYAAFLLPQPLHAIKYPIHASHLEIFVQLYPVLD